MSDDFVPQPEDSIRLESLKNELNSALNLLNEREALVLRLFFGLDRDGPMSLAEIGAQLNLSRERIRQIKERALQRLRRSNKVREGLRAYLG